MSYRAYFDPYLRSFLNIDWPEYIAAAFKRFTPGLFEDYYVIAPLPPGSSTVEAELYVDVFGVSVRVKGFPVRRVFKGIYAYESFRPIAGFVSKLCSEGEVVFYMNDLFTVNFLFDYSLLKALRGTCGSRVRVVAHQHSSPPYRYYVELSPKYLPLAVAGEAVFRGGLAGLVDGYVVNNWRTFNYLSRVAGIGRVVFQHVGVDYEYVSPWRVGFSGVAESVRDRVGCDYVLATYAHVTLKRAGYAKGVDLLPVIARRLWRRGLRVCILVLGKIVDERLASRLKEAPGVKLLGFMPRREALRVVSSADAYILPARRQSYYGGVGVAVIEALALDKPVVSPTLEHVPLRSVVGYLGVETPWLTLSTIDEFVEGVVRALRDPDRFKPRRFSRGLYDVRVMARRISRLFR